MELSWEDAVALLSYNRPATFLKFIATAHQIEVCSIAEIGVYFGQSSLSFRAMFPKAQLYLIDPWELDDGYAQSQGACPPSHLAEHYEKGFLHVQRTFSNDPNTHILRTTSKNAAKVVPNGLDLVFIDGNHAYEHVLEDIELWSKKVRVGGIISGHDYRASFPQIVKAVDESFPRVQVGSDFTWFVFKS